MRRIVFLAAAWLLAGPAIAQDKPAETPATPQSDVIVTGGRETPRERIKRAVRALAPERRDRQLSRWNYRVCARVIGLWPERDRMILDRMGAVAKKVGVSYEEAPKCTANTVIFFTTAADEFVKVAIDKFPGLLKDVERNGLPQRADKAPYMIPRPVRWMPVNQTELAGGALVGAGSRIRPPTRENTVGTLIIVDEPKLDRVKWNQLVDYLAMVTFAQPRLDADYSTIDSVMALFDARDAGRELPAGLTVQDLAFLTALYSSPDDRTVDEQRDEIERMVAKALKQG